MADQVELDPGRVADAKQRAKELRDKAAELKVAAEICLSAARALERRWGIVTPEVEIDEPQTTLKLTPEQQSRLIRDATFGHGDYGLECVICGGTDYGSPDVQHKDDCPLLSR